VKAWGARKTGLLLLSWLGLSVAYLLVIEGITVADSMPMNHITAVMRQAFAKEPGVFMWLAFSAGWLGGHLFWSKR
jgi:hypothetical protein